MLKHNFHKIAITMLLTMVFMLMAMMLPVTAAAKSEAEIATAQKASAVTKIDGSLNEAVWTKATWNEVARRQEATTLNNTVKFATAWDDKNLYIAIKVVDDTVVKTNLNENIYCNDGIEIFLDPKNSKTEKVYDDKTLHLMYQVADGKWALWGGVNATTDVKSKFSGVQVKHALTNDGYVVEASFPFAALGINKPWDGTVMGLEVTNNDDDNSNSNAETDRGILYWNQTTVWDNPATWGSVCLYYTVTPVVSYMGTPTIDGVISKNENWTFTSEKVNNNAGTTYRIASMCDVENLYLAVEFVGSGLDQSVASFFIDRDDERGEQDQQFIQIVNYSLSGNKSDYTRVGAEGSFNYSPQITTNAKKSSNGYVMEIKIALSEFAFATKPLHLDTIGMEIDFMKTKDDYTDSSRSVWSQAVSGSMWSSSLPSGSIILNNTNVAGGSNNAPTGNQIASYSIAQGTKLSGKITITDPDGDPLTFKLDPSNTQAGKSSGTFNLNTTTGEWTYTPPSDSFRAPGGVNYYILASDPSGASFHQRIEIRIESTPTYKTYHVDGDNGNDSNDGSSASRALKSLYTAINRVKPGDTVIIHESSVPYGYNDKKVFEITASGLPDAYITFKAAEGEIPVINPRTDWNTFKVSGSYIKIEGLTFLGQGHELVHNYEERYEAYRRTANGETTWKIPGASKYQTNGFSIYPDNGKKFSELGIDKVSVVHHVEIRNCLVDGMTGAGIGVAQCDYIVIENNTVMNNCWGNMYACSGISVLGTIDIDDKFGEYKIIVRNNITAGNRHFVPWISLRRFSDGNGIIIDSTNNVSTNSELLSKGDKWGAQPYMGRILVANNLSYLNGGSGIHVFDGDYTDLINNTVYSNSSTPILGYSDFYVSQANSINMYNNIVYSRTGAKMQISSAANSEVYYDNNLFYNYSSSNNNLGKNLNGSSGKVGTVAGTNNIYGKDPMFKNVYEVKHDQSKGYPNSWTAEMKEFAKNSGYYVGANYSVTDLGYDFSLKAGSPALGKGNKEWSDRIGNSDNRLGVFGTIGSSLRPFTASDADASADIKPVETKPVETKPVETKPIETKPVETKPVETKPVETKPVETKPVETKPVETKPVETKPIETKPIETKPVETKPVETKPAETEPVETKPVETQPAETEPVETKPVETQPIETQPVETQPEEVTSAESKIEETTPEEITSEEIDSETVADVPASNDKDSEISESKANDSDELANDEESHTINYILIGGVIGIGVITAVILVLRKTKAKKS